MKKANRWIALGAILGALAVAIGAFGAHALKDLLAQTGRTATFETASRYHFYHALALIGLGLSHFHFQNRYNEIAGGLFLVGIAIFSGSLYLLCLTGITWLGAITPIGGVALIVAWVLWGIGFLSKK
ncbi:DUF423 domain-containing protein [Hugenholtzia roseola]|uniref:DUF423 domain-containing protein n=1 Tax=Hugenholtzia roseola TaxID=1002 RepID=UPI0003FADD84|nr:DUF423 domain-containing protein [Hugenholtzia roseola]